jgi:hypothetical protein
MSTFLKMSLLKIVFLCPFFSPGDIGNRVGGDDDNCDAARLQQQQQRPESPKRNPSPHPEALGE